MSNKKFSFKFYPREDKQNVEGTCPIYARILAEKKFEISTTMYVELKSWNYNDQRVNKKGKNADTINSFLDSFHSKVLEAYSSLFVTKTLITAEVLKERIFGKIETEKTLMEIIVEHNSLFEKRIGVDYSYGSFKNYKTTKKYLEEFIQHQYSKKDIPISKVNYNFCEHYFSFLTSLRPCNVNGANKHIQRLKKIVNFSYKMGYVDSNRLLAYSLKFNPFVQEKLTWEEIDSIKAIEPHNNTLMLVRDVFLFQCFTGLAYSDVKKLCYNHLIKGVDDNLWINMSRTKTKREFSVPVLKPAMDILDKYFIRCREGENVLFPVLSNQKMNAALKIIGEVSGIKKSLSTHVARHTFATTITLLEGVPLETVSKMLGHSKIATTQIYSVVTQLKISRDIISLNKMLENK